VADPRAAVIVVAPVMADARSTWTSSATTILAEAAEVAVASRDEIIATPETAIGSSAVVSLDTGGAGTSPGPCGKDQTARRRKERALRMGSAVFRQRALANGFSGPEAAALLDLSPRTLSCWYQRFTADDLEARPRGRPPQRAPAERSEAVRNFLAVEGPSLSVATLKAAYPDITRAELLSLRQNFCARWRAAHRVERCELEWLHPGNVWAMDFSHPPHLVDGWFRAIFNVVDLASHQQLLWLAVDREDTATVINALADLFEEHGAPLVLKCDNGPAFVARLTKSFLDEWSVFPLYSPPYCPRYNGGCERANRTLKELTEHLAESAGRAGFWTSDDLLEARQRANRLRRPWGAAGRTPEEAWNIRDPISLDKRENM
jgi:transposase InsO family protein